MAPADGAREQDLRQREAELRERELTLRLKEMEMELQKAKGDRLSKNTIYSPTNRPGRTWRWRRNAIEGLKLFAVVVAVMAAIRIAYWLASVLMVLGVGYLVYKLYFARRFNQD
ncbi:MAG: hypothetical protein AAF974_02585 [Cyanobacteria bacterium P01_E01_bin.34]